MSTSDVGDRSPSLDAAPEVVARIDRLAEASRAAPDDRAAMAALWRAVLGLDRWIFIARGDAEHPMPFAAAMPQGPMVLAFTTAQRAHDAGLSMGLSSDEASRLLATPLPGAIEWAATLQGAGIVALALDHGTIGAFAPLTNLVPMRDWFAANPVR
ncbi:hypothetical protein GCM10009846_14140 [Agrococcus versicolor]|uniref:SseB protein N-terminal domain-containing protein n=1 Tax=Agrococcus versicolor TaxID=501482 RepID=A0ABN3APJ8_9MICO